MPLERTPSCCALPLLYSQLETPINFLQLRICWAEVSLYRLLLKDKGTALRAETHVEKARTHAAIRTGVEMNLFEELAEDDVAAKSNAHLAAMTSADPVLLQSFDSRRVVPVN